MTLGFLRTRVGRRYLAVNLLSAILPLAGISGVSYVSVRRELQVQAGDQVLRMSKTLSTATLSALSSAASDMREETFGGGARAVTAPTLVGTVVRDASRGVPSSLLDSTTRRALTADERSQLEAGRSLLALSPDDGETRIFLALARLPWRGGQESVVWGLVDATHLWSATEEALSDEKASFCVFEAQSLTAIHCSPELAAPDVASAHAYARRGEGERTVESVGAYLLAAREAYLRHGYAAPEWQMVAMLPAEISLGALASFGRLFVLLMLAMPRLPSWGTSE